MEKLISVHYLRLQRGKKFRFDFVVGLRRVRFYYSREKYHLLYKRVKWYFEGGYKKFRGDAYFPRLSIQLPRGKGYYRVTPIGWSHHNLPKTLLELNKLRVG